MKKLAHVLLLQGWSFHLKGEIIVGCWAEATFIITRAFDQQEVFFLKEGNEMINYKDHLVIKGDFF